MTQSSDSSTSQAKHQRSFAEWVSFAIAAAIIASVLGLVAYTWATGDTQPPVLETEITPEVRQAGSQFYIPFSVTNTGGGTAESVQVIAELRVNGEVIETGEQQFDFLSGGEKAEGAFVFQRDPAQGDLSLRVASYSLP
ncbi:TIGR02588 family protein [Geitlerinema sp. PCC 7407]|uniref:TIGR02588 family protein n=1 Tax=Geitlerinema sp. PCC 7407 TaxID=1173025 RepID=UPI00029FF483|nr:TIGR02588 family protein [Geitlerinema sp. PCC 7407]AFY66023.1 hypothetical protein GEI7407_1531 [Geitlerinema sp. PCC 7407]